MHKEKQDTQSARDFEGRDLMTRTRAAKTQGNFQRNGHRGNVKHFNLADPSPKSPLSHIPLITEEFTVMKLLQPFPLITASHAVLASGPATLLKLLLP